MFTEDTQHRVRMTRRGWTRATALYLATLVAIAVLMAVFIGNERSDREEGDRNLTQRVAGGGRAVAVDSCTNVNDIKALLRGLLERSVENTDQLVKKGELPADRAKLARQAVDQALKTTALTIDNCIRRAERIPLR